MSSTLDRFTFDTVFAPPPALTPPLPDLLPMDGVDEGTNATNDGQGPVVQPIPFPPLHIRSVRAGCWLVSYTPTAGGLIAFDGTVRVESHSAGRTASGDLYQRPVFLVPIQRPPAPPVTIPMLAPAPSPARGIPVLARNRYRYYLRVTQILERITLAGSFPLGFEMWRYTAPNAWANEGAYTAQMTWIAAPAGYPSAADYLEGDVKNAAGAVVGRLKMGWVSRFYRRASVEIDAVAGCERPVDNGAGIGWSQVFEALGWDVSVRLSDTDVAEPSGAGWSDAEMHAAMLARRDPVSLDSDWRYHILAVKTIDSTPRGIMYDSGATDSDNVPREGVGIATNWMIPNTPDWGLVRGQRFGAAAAPFFRTAVHELGHAMSLYHTTVDNGFMNTTDVIAAAGTAAAPFPTNIKWAYADANLAQLRHYPDVFVRPGGTAFGTASTTTPAISPTDRRLDMPELTLEVTPLLGEVPIGAPVRVGLQLVNTGTTTQRVPARISLKTDVVRGWVRGPSGTVRSFRPLMACVEDEQMIDLHPGEAVTDSLTLLRGGEGALFPAPGLHDVTVEVHWELDGMEAVAAGSGSVLVTGAQDASHAAAAHAVLATPDAHLVLVLGGDHLIDGVSAIERAIADSVLRPHFAVVEAKRVAQRFGARAPQLDRAAALMDGPVVMSDREAEKVARLTQDARADAR